MLTLLWLTVSTPFIADIKKNLQKASTSITSASDDIDSSMEDNSNPFSGLNEEKCGNSANAFSEYLHEHFHLPVIDEAKLIHESYSGNLVYVAYYGELLSPPPEV